MSDDLPSAPVSRSDGHPDETMPIGSVLDALIDDFPDISISKIRFLESRGLITPERAPSGYRRFSGVDVERLRWILTMQRDYFLPLRVIRERLEDGVDASGAAATADHVPSIAAPELSPRTPSSRFRAPGPESDNVDAADVARMAGLTASQLAELVHFGIVEPEGDRYSRDELRIAKAAGAFLQRGIEARHLKAWRVAAEREAGMLEQIVVPLSRQNAPDATTRAREVADDLIDMGNTIREAIIVKSLRRSLGSAGD
jgi:DNA-binding transcriptional MerR regulator